MNVAMHAGRSGWLLAAALLLGTLFAPMVHAVHAFLTTPPRVDLAAAAIPATH